MKRTIIIIVALSIAACTTPETVMQNPKTGETFTCGGHSTMSWVAGVPGYYAQKSHDQECVSDHIEMGFKRLNNSSNSN